jgi:transcriptional regulator with XRE-family HTH domain
MNCENDIDTRIASNLKKIRLSHAMTLQNVANMLGISYQQLQKYEQGKNRISASRLYKVCEVLNMDVCKFYK